MKYPDTANHIPSTASQAKDPHMERQELSAQLHWLEGGRYEDLNYCQEQIRHVADMPMGMYFLQNRSWIKQLADDLQIDEAPLADMSYREVVQRIAEMHSVSELSDRVMNAAWLLACPYLRREKERL